jgi:hypothetical protein
MTTDLPPDLIARGWRLIARAVPTGTIYRAIVL